MSSPYRSKEFLALKDRWYARLAKEGFEDIERNEHALKLWHSEYFADPRRYDPNAAEARQTYYRIAGQFLNDHKFKNAWEKKVWAMHAEGLGIREIAANIKRPGLKDKVHITLNRLETEMINKAKNKS